MEIVSSIGFRWSYCIICPPSQSSTLWLVLLYNITSLLNPTSAFCSKSRLLLSQFLMNIRISLKTGVLYPLVTNVWLRYQLGGQDYDVGEELVKLLRFIFFGTPLPLFFSRRPGEVRIMKFFCPTIDRGELFDFASKKFRTRKALPRS